MMTFSVFSHESGAHTDVRAKSHEDAAERWAKSNLDAVGDATEIVVRTITTTDSRRFHVKMSIVVSEVAS